MGNLSAQTCKVKIGEIIRNTPGLSAFFKKEILRRTSYVMREDEWNWLLQQVEGEVEGVRAVQEAKRLEKGSLK